MNKDRRTSVDRRWRGVTVPSLWGVVLRVTDPEDDRDALAKQAWDVIRAGGEWRGYEAVFSEGTQGRQVLGYRRVNPKDWFILSDSGLLDGPFPTKKLVLWKLRVKRASKVLPGVYLAQTEHEEHTLFTRDAAPSVGLNRSELP